MDGDVVYVRGRGRGRSAGVNWLIEVERESGITA